MSGISKDSHSGKIAHDSAFEFHRDYGAPLGFWQVDHAERYQVTICRRSTCAARAVEQPNCGVKTFVLASGSVARSAVLSEEGFDFVVDRPDVDERVHDGLLESDGPESLALLLAGLKADAVASRHPDSLVLAADQVGILSTAAGLTMLKKQPTFELAVAQLLDMSGSVHQLINGLVLVDTTTGQRASGTDIQTVTMRTFSRAAAESYVRRFEPYESSGSYRIEDQQLLEPQERLLDRIDGEDVSGVRGLPLGLMRRLMNQLPASG